jgi:hypothetical protein
MTTVAITILLSGVLIFLLSLPMIYRKVPMNHFYGVRIPAAFESDRCWYDINAYGGRLMAIGSLPIVGAGVTGLFLPADWLLPHAWAATVVALVSVLAPLVLVLRWSRLNGPS